MADLKQLYEIYDAYTQETLEAWNGPLPFDGTFAQGNDFRRYPFHEHFYHAVQSWVSEFLAQNPDEEQVFQAAHTILTAAHQRRGTDTCWFCCTAQGLASDLILFLTPEHCHMLAELYDSLYPKWNRHPVQKALYEQLLAVGK